MTARQKKAAEAAESVFRFQLDGKPYEIDINALTFGELEDMEVYFDLPFGDIDIESGRGTMFLAYLAKRRVEPKSTLDEIRALPVVALTEATGDRPTSAAGASGTPAS